MSQKYCLLATEGPHDQAAISRLLQLSGFKNFDGTAKDLDPFWEGFIPKFPKKGNLYKRMDMPSILTSQTHSIAIYWGEGSNLIPNLEVIATNHRRYVHDIHAFGLIIDADESSPKAVAKKKATALRGIFPTISEIPGEIAGENPKTGIYILPDNKRKGVLDSVLVDCASLANKQYLLQTSGINDSFPFVLTYIGQPVAPVLAYCYPLLHHLWAMNIGTFRKIVAKLYNCLTVIRCSL